MVSTYRSMGMSIVHTVSAKLICKTLLSGNFPDFYNRHSWQYHEHIAEEYGSVSKFHGPFGVCFPLDAAVDSPLTAPYMHRVGAYIFLTPKLCRASPSRIKRCMKKRVYSPGKLFPPHPLNLGHADYITSWYMLSLGAGLLSTVGVFSPRRRHPVLSVLTSDRPTS